MLGQLHLSHERGLRPDRVGARGERQERREQGGGRAGGTASKHAGRSPANATRAILPVAMPADRPPVAASKPSPVAIRPMSPADWPAVARIYAEGIATGTATFETAVPTWEAWDAAHVAAARLVAELDGAVVAWAALTPVSGRCVYAGVAEVSVYVGAEARGRGVGRRLLTALVEASEEAGFWTLQAGIFARNAASIALHERCGFRMVGVRERIGALRGEWLDTVLMERRSAAVGRN
jgi:phosphinothricin acetyltransferase